MQFEWILEKAIKLDDVDTFLRHVDCSKAFKNKLDKLATQCIDSSAEKCFEALYRVDNYYFEDDYETGRLVKIVQSPPNVALANMFVTCLQMGARLDVGIDTWLLFHYETLKPWQTFDWNFASKHGESMTLSTFLRQDVRGWQPIWEVWLAWKASINAQLAFLPTCLVKLTRSYISMPNLQHGW
jgi:hypothetical protein